MPSFSSTPPAEPKATGIGPVRLGLLGLNFGEHLAQDIARQSADLQLVAACDLDPVKVERVAQTYHLTPYLDLDALLEDPNVEAVGMFTGAAGRAQLLSKILQKGRHVLTTKPFELEAAAAKRVLDEARDLGLVVQLNSPSPDAPEDIAAIRHWIVANQLGRPLSFQARTWASYREQANGTWYDDPDKAAAAPILRLGVYFLNEFAGLMGMPRSVYVSQSRLFTGRPTADHAHLTVEFENGAIGSILASFCVQDGRPYRDEITLNFENGTISRWMERHLVGTMGGDHAIVELYQKDRPTQRVETTPGHFAGWYQWQAFRRAVRNNEGTSGAYAESILYGVRLIEAMRRSAQSGSPQAV